MSSSSRRRYIHNALVNLGASDPESQALFIFRSTYRYRMVDADVAFLLIAAVATGVVIGFFVGKALTGKTKELEFGGRLKDARKESVAKSRSTLSGQFLEKLAPSFPDFPYDPTELRFLGTPVDYVVFQGLSSGRVDKIVFLEIKSGEADLTTEQRRVRDAIGSNRVDWQVYRPPE